jgi:hypothetical protein
MYGVTEAAAAIRVYLKMFCWQQKISDTRTLTLSVLLLYKLQGQQW